MKEMENLIMMIISATIRCHCPYAKFIFPKGISCNATRHMMKLKIIQLVMTCYPSSQVIK